MQTIESSLDLLIIKSKDFCKVISRIINGNRDHINLENANSLIDSILGMRGLISDLEQFERKQTNLAHRIHSINFLKERYLNLEGTLKEIRNDLHSGS